MKYRGRININNPILETANGGDATPNGIIYDASLNLPQFTEYLRVSTECDLLSYDELMHTFKTTEKDLRYLNTNNHVDVELTHKSKKKMPRRHVKGSTENVVDDVFTRSYNLLVDGEYYIADY
jgi:predicted transcriptional regulator